MADGFASPWEQRLTAIGATCAAEMLLYLPLRYEDYTRTVTVMRDLMLGEQACLRLHALEDPQLIAGSPDRLEFMAEDETHEQVRVICFGRVWEFNWVTRDKYVNLFGHLKLRRDELQITSPALVRRDVRGRVVPVYQRKKGRLSGKRLAEEIGRQFERLLPQAVELICARVGMDEAAIVAGAKPGFDSLGALLAAIHRPASMEQARRGVDGARRLAAFHVVTRAARLGERPPVPGAALRVPGPLVAEIAARLPHALTDEQKACIREIVADLRAPVPMRRLLSGDIGHGKTCVYAVPAVAAHEAGARVAVLMPSLLLAEQVHAELKSWFPRLDLALVTGDGPRDAAGGGRPLLVGTQALLFLDDPRVRGLDLLVIDEQHKFSREQRESLLAAHTNVLEVTATCIPRTAALVSYGGMALSAIRRCPVAKTLHTAIVDDGGKADMFAHVREIVASGGQVAIIYPEVGARAGAEIKNIADAVDRWERWFPGRVGVLHGKMADRQKAEVLARMKRGDYDVLIASTVIEVGVTIPSLRAMVVVQAERHGVNTLHQLRGRVARKGGEGWFYLYLPTFVSEESLARLRLLVTYASGFDLAEADMRQRGFGDLAEDASTQTGASDCLFLNLTLMPDDIARALPDGGAAGEGAGDAAAPAAAPPTAAWRQEKLFEWPEAGGGDGDAVRLCSKNKV